jgi:hypothetical protein
MANESTDSVTVENPVAGAANPDSGGAEQPEQHIETVNIGGVDVPKHIHQKIKAMAFEESKRKMLRDGLLKTEEDKAALEDYKQLMETAGKAMESDDSLDTSKLSKAQQELIEAERKRVAEKLDREYRKKIEQISTEYETQIKQDKEVLQKQHDRLIVQELMRHLLANDANPKMAEMIAKDWKDRFTLDENSRVVLSDEMERQKYDKYDQRTNTWVPITVEEYVSQNLEDDFKRSARASGAGSNPDPSKGKEDPFIAGMDELINSPNTGMKLGPPKQMFTPQGVAQMPINGT